MIERILIPVDFSEASLQALEYALDLNRKLKAQLIVLHVVEPVYYPAVGATSGIGIDVGNVYDQVERAAREGLSQLSKKLRARRVAARTMLSFGSAHQVIVETAKKLKVDLIIMSTHGRTGLSHVLMGSVAERVLRTASCAVVTVPGRAVPTRRRSVRGRQS